MLDSMATGPGQQHSLDEFARRQIKRWLHATHLTQTQLAEQIGRNQAWMSRYLAGDYDADLETLRRIAAVFGHTLSTLLTMPTDPDDSEVVLLFRALNTEDRLTLLRLLRAWTGAARRPRGRSRK